MSDRNAILIDVSKCIGCRGCQVACKQWNQLGAEKTRFTGTYQNPPKLSAQTWTLVKFIEPEAAPVRWLFRKMQCMHCGEPSCEQVCPTGAAKKQPGGAVLIDQNVCAGCKNCVEACPFHAPQADHAGGTVKKCRMCIDRTSAGLEPACATACPTGAIRFGPRDEIVRVAKARQAVLAKKSGVSPRLYGETELGGLGVMYLLPEKASIYGLPERPTKPTVWIGLKWLAGVLPGAALLYGAWRALAHAQPEPAAEAPGAERTDKGDTGAKS
jgi:formate dehydrogenase iron-sulfur subunit